MNATEARAIPATSMVERLRTVFRLGGNPVAWLAALSERHGDMVRTAVGPVPLVLINDPAVVHEVLVKNDKILRKDDITGRLKEVMGNGLLTSENPEWRQNRRLIAPSFQRKELARYAELMVHHSQVKLGEIKEGVPFNLHEEGMDLTLRIVVACLFGDTPVPTAEIGEALEVLMHRFVRELRSWRRFAPTWAYAHERVEALKKIETLNAILDDVIEKGRQRSDLDRPDLLARLLAARDEAGKGFTHEQLKDEVMTIFLAGHETTALTFTFALVLLDRNPAVRERVEAEIDSVVGEGDLNVAHVRQLPWLDATVNEALRLYPPAWAIGRKVEEDFQAGGWNFSAGDNLVVSPWLMHRQGKLYDNPEQFQPERWFRTPEKSLPKGSFIPFGYGARTCVGNHFAKMELILALATWMRTHRFHAAPGVHLDELIPSVTLRPTAPIVVTASRR